MRRKNAGERSALIVDDDADLRLTLRLTLELAAEPVHVMGEAASGEEALTRWRELRPDVVILDARLPGLSGLETARRMLSEDPEQLIVLCTGLPDTATEEAAAEMGIRACLSKAELKRLPELLQG
jgi:CheY-like chemotaxis protein